MKRFARHLALIAFAFAAGFAARDMAGAQPPPVTAKTVLQSDVKGGVFEEAVVQVYEFGPGAALPWHIHPDAHEIAYILDGALTLEIEGQGTRVFKQGDASHVAPNEVHRGFADATLGTRLVAVRFKPKDKPLVTLIQR